MNNFISQYWPEIISLLFGAISLFLAIMSLVIAKKAWHKSRVIYGIKRTTLKYVRGRSDDAAANQRIDEINRKLLSGKYTIITVFNRKDDDFEIILGKVKK